MSLLQRLKSIFIVNMGILSSSVLSLIVHIYFAKEYGITKLADAFFMAFSIVETFSKILFISQFSQVFLTMFWDEYLKNKECGWRFLGSVYFTLVFLCLIFTLLSVLFGDFVVKIFAPGFAPDTLRYSAKILYILFPYLFFNMFYILNESVVNKFGNFPLSSATNVLKHLSVLVIFVLLDDIIGVFSIAISYLVSEIMSSFILFIYIVKGGFRVKSIVKPDCVLIKAYFNNLKPFIISNLSVFVVGLSYKVAVSFLSPGAMSILSYSRKIYNMLANFSWAGMGKVIYPEFVEFKRGGKKLKEIILFSVRFSAIFGIIFLLVFSIWGGEILKIVFLRGKMTEEDISEIVKVLVIYLLSFVPDGISNVLGQLFISLGKVRITAYVGLISAVLHSVLYIIMSKLYGYYGIAISPLLVLFVILAIYVANLKKIELGDKH